jgi:hypothetical protein
MFISTWLLSQGDELLDLCAVRGICEAARPHAVAERKGHVILLRDINKAVILGVQRVLGVIHYDPLQMERSAATYDIHDPALVPEPLHALSRHTTVHGDEVHAFGALLLDDAEQKVPVHLDYGLALLHGLDRRLIDGHRADGDGGLPQDLLTDAHDRPARGEVHHRVGPDSYRHLELLDLVGDGHPVLGCPDVGIDLGAEPPADAEGRDALVPVVAGDDDGPVRDAVTDVLNTHAFRPCHSLHLGGNVAFSRFQDLGHAIPRFVSPGIYYRGAQ